MPNFFNYYVISIIFNSFHVKQFPFSILFLKHLIIIPKKYKRKAFQKKYFIILYIPTI